MISSQCARARGVVLAWLGRDAETRAQEGGAQFGDEFFPGVSGGAGRVVALLAGEV